MEIIDNSAKYVFFEDLECGDVFKTYDNQIFMKTCDIQAVHYDDYNAVNLENGEFECFGDKYEAQKLNAVLTIG